MVDKIAFCGPAGSGKDYLANILVAELGFHKMALAAPMKEMVAIALDTDVETVDKLKSTTPAVRKVLQMIGTEVFRQNFDEMFWINRLLTRVDRMEKSGETEGIVVTDCRFKNELRSLAKRGFLTVYVDSPEQFKRIKEPRNAFLRLIGRISTRWAYRTSRHPYYHPSEAEPRELARQGAFHERVWNDRTNDAHDLLYDVMEAGYRRQLLTSKMRKA